LGVRVSLTSEGSLSEAGLTKEVSLIITGKAANY